MNQSARRPLTRALFALTVAAAVLVLVPVASAKGDEATRNKKAFFDIRETPASQLKLHGRAADLDANPSAATSTLKDSLGAEGFVDLDPLTSTVRAVGSTDGFLTSPSAAPASAIALGYAANNAAGSRADAADARLAQARADYVSIDGTHHLLYQQSIKRRSRLRQRPQGERHEERRTDQRSRLPSSPTLRPRRRRRGSAAGEGDRGRKVATPVALGTVPCGATRRRRSTSAPVDGTRLAYQTHLSARDTGLYQSVVDANSRQGSSTAAASSTTRTASVWDNYPGAPVGGTQHSVNLTQWLTPGATTLTGPNAHVYSDVNDDNAADAGEDSPRQRRGRELQLHVPGLRNPPFGNTINSDCTAAFPCSWDSSFPTGAAVLPGQTARGSWTREPRAERGRRCSSSSTTSTTTSRRPRSGSPPRPATSRATTRCRPSRTTAPARSRGIFPDPNHTDNANMSTPPDGMSPRMQMYLFNDPVADDPIFGGVPRADPFIQATAATTPTSSTTSTRTACRTGSSIDADGNSTLGNVQAGSMGEAWSDWYAMDYLVDTGQLDRHRGRRRAAGRQLRRCRRGPDPHPADGLPGRLDVAPAATAGRRRHGRLHLRRLRQDHRRARGPRRRRDLGRDALGSARRALGSDDRPRASSRARWSCRRRTRRILDMRNAILAGRPGRLRRREPQHDLDASSRTAAWATSPGRSTVTTPSRSRTSRCRPDGRRRRKLEGTVTDGTRAAARRARSSRSAVTPPASRRPRRRDREERASYEVKKILFGTYPDVVASGPGYDGRRAGHAHDRTPRPDVDFQLRRDWAALSGGGSIAIQRAGLHRFGCGPSGAIDQSAGERLGQRRPTVTTASSTGNVTPKFIVVAAADCRGHHRDPVNPSNTCGDPGSSSTARLQGRDVHRRHDVHAAGDRRVLPGNRAKENTVFTGTSRTSSSSASGCSTRRSRRPRP